MTTRSVLQTMPLLALLLLAPVAAAGPVGEGLGEVVAPPIDEPGRPAPETGTITLDAGCSITMYPNMYGVAVQCFNGPTFSITGICDYRMCDSNGFEIWCGVRGTAVGCW